MAEKSLFAFLDILGTKALIESGEFGDLHALDFVNPVGIAAQLIPSVRFAAFSDCVMISAHKNNHEDFISAISFCYSQWCADHVFVRGAISFDEIHWVDDSNTDARFKRLSNFTYARIHGKALVSAYKLEGSSGPGVLCFISDNASEFLQKKANFYILHWGQTDSLIWCNESDAHRLKGIFETLAENSTPGSEKHKHFRATMKYFQALTKNDAFFPDKFGLISEFRMTR
ncbi:hypothetical protein [Desulfotignum phosphitoxidans]|jgi:hypothetical protein|uniref:Uncharacterized protein n=1 Tax=Desulfotignum phosphitoxidans DSM 13687 TaxID=1286635 RepID=S0G4I6_9BACT|nr:hypothetical protein [Desulfotignum phosphitoxidans]EMS78846.1 hypothetical protein Dpo_6c00450 [Desulfotignum phosphitoxidans DSM 13687]